MQQNLYFSTLFLAALQAADAFVLSPPPPSSITTLLSRPRTRRATAFPPLKAVLPSQETSTPSSNFVRALSVRMPDNRRPIIPMITELIAANSAKVIGGSSVKKPKRWPHTTFLESSDSLDEETDCGYDVVCDPTRKFFFVTFCGSVEQGTPRKWRRTLQIAKKDMTVPLKLQEKYFEATGENHTSVKVHGGYYDYLFNNTFTTSAKGTPEQKYNQIKSALEPLLKRYRGYKVYVIGHGLGGALASLVAFQLAAAQDPWLPRPVNCVTFASPRVGGSAFRTLFQFLEQGQQIKYLRVTNEEDIVPAGPALGYKHVGVNLILTSCKNKHKFIYPRDTNKLQRCIRNSLFFKMWKAYSNYRTLFQGRRKKKEDSSAIRKFILRAASFLLPYRAVTLVLYLMKSAAALSEYHGLKLTRQRFLRGPELLLATTSMDALYRDYGFAGSSCDKPWDVE